MAKRKSVLNWSDVPDSVIKDFTKAVFDLRKKMLPIDCDGDEIVEIELTDRRKFPPSHYFPIPYQHKATTPEELNDIGRDLLVNLSIAHDAVQMFAKCKDSMLKRMEQADG
jgi:hypothetical protein